MDDLKDEPSTKRAQNCAGNGRYPKDAASHDVVATLTHSTSFPDPYETRADQGTDNQVGVFIWFVIVCAPTRDCWLRR